MKSQSPLSFEFRKHLRIFEIYFSNNSFSFDFISLCTGFLFELLISFCPQLISCAFQRCRKLDDLCRLSVSIKSEPPLVRISVSDTGVGSTLEEFIEFNIRNDFILAGKWDGVLCIVTTSISDNEIHHLKLDMKESASSKRFTRQPSATKNGAKFSGTEVLLSVSENINVLLVMVTTFIRKMLVLKYPKIAIELSVDSGDSLGSKLENIVLQNACSTLPMHASNIDYLKMGMEDYVSKHGNRLVEDCHSCFSTRKNLKVGAGVACSTRNQRSGGQVMEVVIIISEIPGPAQSSCFRLYGRKTEVLYFEDFSPCSIPRSSLHVLASIEWKAYGLTLRSAVDQDEIALLEWENLPPFAHIDIVLHKYHKQVLVMPCTRSSQVDRALTIKSVKLALNELKEKNAGVLLSERALKIASYAPDLAKTISGLVFSSYDLNFQAQCFSLLGLQSQESERNIVEKCIKDRIISVISKNDRNPCGTREAPCLFGDNTQHEPYDASEEYEEGEQSFSYLDL